MTGRDSPMLCTHVPHFRSQDSVCFVIPIRLVNGIPPTGVHQFDDSLIQPKVVDGVMEPLPESS